LHLLVFHAYINEIHGSRSKIPGENLVRQRCAEEFNSGVKGLKRDFQIPTELLPAQLAVWNEAVNVHMF
jgi:hypothetical protein